MHTKIETRGLLSVMFGVTNEELFRQDKDTRHLWNTNVARLGSFRKVRPLHASYHPVNLVSNVVMR